MLSSAIDDALTSIVFSSEHAKHPEGCTEGGMHSTDRHDGLHRFYHRRRPERRRQDIHGG